MPATKLIYGVGRVPKASEFALGEIIVNVDDSKVYSKSKQNKVFEIGGNNTTIIGGGGTPTVSTIKPGFTTASVGSGLYTSTDTSILKFRGGTGINITTGTGNEIFITATGDTEVTNAVNADTASYVEIAQTASYVNTSNIDGTLFEFSSDGDQGGIIFSENNINNASNVNAYAAGLSETSNVTFAQVSSSGLLFASASEETTGGSNIRTVVYDTGSGQFYFTGSYGGGGGNTITGTDTQILFFDGDDNPVGSTNLTFDKTTKQIKIGAQGDLRFNPNAGGNDASVSNISHLGGGTEQKIQFYQAVNYDSTYSRHIRTIIGSREYTRANYSNGAKGDRAFIINHDDDNVDFIVSGSDFHNEKGLFVVAVDSNNVGVGFGSSSLNATYGDYKLAVSGAAYFLNNINTEGNITASGNISSSGYVNTNLIQGTATNGTTSHIKFNETNSTLGIRVSGTDGYRFGGTVFRPNVAGISLGSDYSLYRWDEVYINRLDATGDITGSNISASGYLKLGSNDGLSEVAGGLMYSSSNEFYLGFS